MEREGKEVHITTEEARGGETPHIVRYVLGVGLVLIVLVFLFTWLLGGP